MLLRIFLTFYFSAGFIGLAFSQQDREVLRQELVTAAAPIEQFSSVLRRSAEFAAPSVVHIEATQVRSVNPSRAPGRSVAMQVEESGSGIIAEIAGKQMILTNRHVVEGIELNSIKIQTADRQILTPQKVITNADFDLAIVETAETLPVNAVLGDSDTVQTGDFVLAFGSPFGLERSVSFGIVSAVKRRNIPAGTGESPRVGFFQIDAAVNPGSSGGPMLNLRGEVVGLITAIATQGGGNEGVAFVLPIKIVRRIAEQLVQNGAVVKPYIGCGFEPAFSIKERKSLGIDRNIGAKINRVLADSPAARAGLQTGDVILAMEDTEVEDDKHIVNLVAESEIGKPTVLKINRKGKTLTITVTSVEQASR